ncbi:MAG TPA: glycoside hydrolase family 16 protein [Streptosporangiaceae bacterium]|jgi:beta-glucanase (GH16 family)
MTCTVPAGFGGYELAWSDEFDGPAGAPADPQTWRADVGGDGWGNEELQYYTDGTQNAAIDGAGNLTIAVRRSDPKVAARDYDGCEFTSARLISNQLVAFRYGLIQARMKLPPGLGIWPAFWLLGADFDEVSWPDCGEIDVLENFGINKMQALGAVHGPGYSGPEGVAASLDTAAPLSDDFHVYSVSWEPDRIRWYVDDRQFHCVTPADLHGQRWVFDHDFFLLVNVAVGGVPSVQPDSTVTFPQLLVVDYIRVYRPPAGG